jgi:hypothetical protein
MIGMIMKMFSTSLFNLLTYLKMHAYQSSSLKKGVKYFTNKFTKQNDNSLEKSMFSIGKEMNRPRGSGKRKKIGRLIPVQVTAKSRREYTHRGRVVGTAGKRLKDQEERRQLVVSKTDENVYHTLPKQSLFSQASSGIK